MYYVKALNGGQIELGNCGLIGAFSSTSGKADTVLTTNGDMLYYNNGRQRLPKADNDDVLTLKSGLPSWETASGGATISNQTITPTNAQTTTSTSYTDIANCDIDLPTRSGGKALITLQCSLATSGSNTLRMGTYFDSAIQNTCEDGSNDHTMTMTVNSIDTLDGGNVKGQWLVSANTATLYDAPAGSHMSSLITFEVS